MRHKHADLIHAWAENMDLQIEIKYAGEHAWTQFDPVMQKWMEHHEYRIKPEKKPDVTIQLRAYKDGYAEKCGSKEGRCEHDNLRLTFSGETGKLIKAEVL